MLQWTFRSMYPFKLLFSLTVLVKYPGIEWLHHIIDLFFHYGGRFHPVFHTGTPIYIPFLTNSVHRLFFLHILVNIYDLWSFLWQPFWQVWWYLIVISICISMMISDVHLFICHLAICVFSFRKMSIHLCPFFNQIVFFWVVWAVYIFWILAPYLSYCLQMFLPM